MFRFAEPAPQLKEFVRRYAQIEMSTLGETVAWPIPARSIPSLEFTFGDPYSVRQIDGLSAEPTRPAMLIGAKTCRRIQLESRGHIDTFGMLFQPTGLQQLFSLPGGLLVDEHYDADSVLGSSFVSLHARLGEAGSFEQRVKIADEFMSDFIPRADSPLRFGEIVNRMISCQGCVRVQALAENAGLSLRQFERRFAQHLGISPKTYARILRFEAALYKKSRSSLLSWTSVAHEMGYCDQAQMIHDFRSLSGESPSHLANHLEFLSSLCAKPN